MSFRYDKDSPVSFTPDHGWRVQLEVTSPPNLYTLPVIGWAVVCRFYDDQAEHSPMTTAIEPVIIYADRYLMTLGEIVAEFRSDGREPSYSIEEC